MNANPPVTISMVILWIVVLIGGPWLLWKWMQKSEDAPGKLLMKIGATILLVALSILVLVKFGPLHGLSAVLVSCMIISLMWASNMGGTLANWLGGFYTDDGSEHEAKPLYSYATAKLNRGDVNGAIAEIRTQLALFPDDYEGLRLLSKIFVERQRNFDEGFEILDRLGHEPQYTPNQHVAALLQLAEWRIKYALDTEGAKADLESIIRRYEGTEAGYAASQRLAHLTPQSMVEEKAHGRTIEVTEGDKHLGLRSDGGTGLVAASVPEGPTARELVDHLELFPEDFEARYRLAGIYTDDFQRHDLAIDQLTQLANLQGQPQKNVQIAMNRLAEVQLEKLRDLDGASKTLRELAERYPGSAIAETALARVRYLALDARGQKPSQVFKLGTYEQNIGLKSGPPKLGK